MKSNLKLIAKFQTIEEVIMVKDVARYLKLTDKQFLRVAALRTSEAIIKQHNQQVADKAAKKQAQEASDVSRTPEVLNQATDASLSSGTSTNPSSSSDPSTSDVVSGSNESQLQSR